MRPIRPARPHNRDGVWYLIRKVPKPLREIDRRGIVRLSTGIAVATDPRAVHASRVVKQLDADLETYWRNLRAGGSDEARRVFEEAQQKARKLSIPYRTADELAEGPVDEILRRVQLLVDRGSVAAAPDEARAVLGMVSRPVLKLSGLVDEYETLQQSGLEARSDEQRRKWRNDKNRPVNSLIEVIGDKPITEITRDDALTFRKWWQNRIKQGLQIGTANRDIGALSRMLKTVNLAYELNMSPPFKDLRIEGHVDAQRLAFPADGCKPRSSPPGRSTG